MAEQNSLPTPPPGCKNWIEAYDKCGDVTSGSSRTVEVLFRENDNYRVVSITLLLKYAAAEMRDKLRVLPSPDELACAIYETLPFALGKPSIDTVLYKLRKAILS